MPVSPGCAPVSSWGSSSPHTLTLGLTHGSTGKEVAQGQPGWDWGPVASRCPPLCACLWGSPRLPRRQDLRFGLMSTSGADSAVAIGFAGGAGQGWLGVGWRPLPSAPRPVSSLQPPWSPGRKHEATKLNSLLARHRPSPAAVLHAPDPVPSVLRVSTLGRSPSGPRPRSSPWSSTPAPRTSGCPLSTARATPAVSDPLLGPPLHSQSPGGQGGQEGGGDS